MKLKSVIDTLATVAGYINPAVGAVIEIVNSFLPEDKKLPITATGADVQNVIATMPMDMQLKLFDSEINLDITESNNHVTLVKSMNEADGVGKSTRPYIALLMAWCVVGQCIAVALAILASVFGDPTGLNALKDNWQLILATIATPTILLRAFFGLRTEEKISRYAALSGQDLPAKRTMLSGVFK